MAMMIQRRHLQGVIETWGGGGGGGRLGIGCMVLVRLGIG